MSRPPDSQTDGASPTASDHAQMHKADRAVGWRIRAARKRAGLTLTALSAELGISYQQLQKYEAGRNRISAGKLVELARILHIPEEWFYANKFGETVTDGSTTPTADFDSCEIVTLFMRIRDSEKRRAALDFVWKLAESETNGADSTALLLPQND